MERGEEGRMGETGHRARVFGGSRPQAELLEGGEGLAC